MVYGRNSIEVISNDNLFGDENYDDDFEADGAAIKDGKAKQEEKKLDLGPPKQKSEKSDIDENYSDDYSDFKEEDLGAGLLDNSKQS